uniref:Bardet-Biedl syndrome 5 protein homolog n=1 Tax=Parastrongyloides trichosuri TaxID=131310 RepID=A0A0N4ZWT7_PARTI
MKENFVYDGIWQDRDICFDLESRLLRLIPGEILIEKIDNVEDTKGNNGDKGVLRITNIRLIWNASSMTRINLSIGFNSVNGVTTRIANSRVRGQAEALYLMAKNASTRFEFIFTCANPSQTKLFTTVIGIHRAYETSKLYRELKMRGALHKEGNLNLLPQENLVEKIDGVWNLSSEQGNLGEMILTNIRVIWYSSINVYYNVSIPYLQLQSARIRDSKFGLALVLETSIQSGDYILGFRVDSMERLENIAKTIQVLHKTYATKPIFGVQYAKDRPQSPTSAVEAEELNEEESEIDDKPLRMDAFAAYFSDGVTKNINPRQPVFSEELGIAIEQLKDGFTLEDLWNINVD